MPRATAQTQGLSHAEALAIAVDNYNQDSAEENVFRLLSAEPRPEWDADLGTPQVLNFTIQETVCPKAESPTPERCDFKADGLVKDCLGSISTGGGPPAVVVTCEPKDGPTRTKRIFRKIMRRLRRSKWTIEIRGKVEI
ncbi:antibacterial peptide PMAP-36-like [Ornithorhynchus anatinus]|uniref:antibacterial peptide PMAP-36-like n=1 Tax=Ornithorhynchus anatinus TaxID=9258 RepID=UPI0010A8CCB1|nr:antibacterial peptide PMAP-36-like [Ornithorhynchus anatinus]